MSEKQKDDLEYSKRIENKLTDLGNELVKSQMKNMEQFRKLEQNNIEDDSDDDDDAEVSLKQHLDLLIIGDSMCNMSI